MIDFSKFGFRVQVDENGKRREDEQGVTYDNGLLEIQHWKKPDVCIIALLRERLIEWKDDFYTEEEAIKLKRPNTGWYVIKDGISASEKKLAKALLNSNFYVYPLYVGAIKDETFFEILINSICADADKLIQCGS